ncbi:unnamed protein product [Bursaphelenchus xylophilus]|uniref:(pine wood nematode) hypothetical protein n=1 Tax=Bursaphelenchus xylophilus TaxID=6326 RepID=A0A1I7RHZ3_BURXY|nr:unnamed protein product [Bursaphelenchus xylophilus]CAG9115271.1 unnamed protein product [Bursaphelenchus xylophilus]
MAEEPQVKKRNLWNPALDEDSGEKEKVEKKAKNQNAMANFQNCLQMLALLQKHQNPAPQLPHPFLQLLTQPNVSPPFFPFPPLLPAPPKKKSEDNPPAAPSTAGPVHNPIVDTVLGTTKGPVNYNCCAICGQSFRLTTDLVQHVRTNHRQNRHKRKYLAE